MGLLIDTNILIDIENGRLSPTRLLRLSQHTQVFMAALTLSELLTGVHLAASEATRIRRSAFVEAIADQVPILPFDEQVARIYAELYGFALRAKARAQKNCHDLQIAATAITHGYPLLTRNLEDFNKIPGLVLESVEA